MKRLAAISFLSIFLFSAIPLLAVNQTAKQAERHSVAPSVNNGKAYGEKKLTFKQRLAIKWAEKKARKVKKSKAKAAADPNKLSTFSLIFGGGAFILVLIPVLGLLAPLAALTGIILGVMALKRGGDKVKVKAILGIVFGALFLVLIVTILIVFLSVFTLA